MLASGRGRRDAWDALLGLLSAAEEELTACADSCEGGMEEDGGEGGAAPFSPEEWRAGVGAYARGMLGAVRGWLVAAGERMRAEEEAAARSRAGGSGVTVNKKRRGW